MLEPARFLIRDNRKGGDYKSVAFLFGFFQLFNYLKLEEIPEEEKARVIAKLNRGAPVIISHYSVIKDLFYKPIY